MTSRKGECQIVYDIKTPYEDVLKAVQESPYTYKKDFLEEGKAAGKLTYTIKGLDNVKIQVCGSTTVNIYVKKPSLTRSELITLIAALKDVFWDKFDNSENLIFRKIVPSPAWMREVFDESEDGKILKKQEQKLREIEAQESI